jgi:hypothetical protein
MHIGNRLAAGVAAAALTVLSATAAGADVVGNELDTSLDAVHEQMNLTLPGSAGTTKLYVIVDGAPGYLQPDDHPNCNINGSHTVTLVPHLSNASVATVTLSNGGVLDACTDKVTVTVTPQALGSTEVSFTGIEQTSNDPHLIFTYEPATFDVNVTQGTSDGGGGTRCEADRAAPAWAAALLKGNGLRAKVDGKPNYISSVARHMEAGATFDTWGKAVHPSYENAVWSYMTTALHLNLPKGPDQVKKPGWNCTPLPTS